MSKVAHVSLFAGCGGFEFGLGEYVNTIYANEFDKYASIVYSNNHKGLLNTTDLRAIPLGEIPNCDILTGGFPCQPFSMAGKRLGKDDPRGEMFDVMYEHIKHTPPKTLLLENVKGLLSIDKGRVFNEILGKLKQIYHNVQYELYNTKYYGIPQNRERLYILATNESYTLPPPQKKYRS